MRVDGWRQESHHAGGSAQLTTEHLVRRRRKTVAGRLAIFLGCVGAHKFYLGQTTNGILYVGFAFTLVPALLGLSDGIILLAMTPERFAQRFGSLIHRPRGNRSGRPHRR